MGTATATQGDFIMSAVGSILTNTGALQALNSISNTSATTTNLQTQLSSGLSINSPAGTAAHRSKPKA
jgi:flagellin